MAVNNAASKKKDKQSKMEKTLNKALVRLLGKVVLIVFLIVLAIVGVIFCGLFNISEIVVEGNSNISADQIVSFSGLQKGMNIFTI